MLILLDRGALHGIGTLRFDFDWNQAGEAPTNERSLSSGFLYWETSLLPRMEPAIKVEHVLNSRIK